MRLFVLAVFLLVPLGGCGYGSIWVEGTFGDQRFEPNGTVFAVIDGHVVEENPGGGINVTQREDKRLTLFFCQPPIDPDVDFAAMSGGEIVALRDRVRRGDRLHIKDLSLSKVVEGARLKASAQEDDFSFVALAGSKQVSSGDSYAQVPPLGRLVKVLFVADGLELKEAGHVGGSITITRDRADDQPANTATGEVKLSFTAPIVGERLGESNLDVLAPVL